MPARRRALCPVRRGVITGIRPYARYQWDASDDESVRELATFVREHRVTLADELAGHVRKVCAPTTSTDDTVIVDSESE